MDQILLYSVMLLWVIQLIVLFALFLLFRQFGFVYLQTGAGVSRDGLAIDAKIPEFQAYSWKRNVLLSHKDLFRKPSLLVFADIQCKPCQELMTDWNDRWRHAHSNISFVLVMIGERKRVESFLQQNQIQGEILFDEQERLLAQFQVRVTPFAFALDAGGIIRDKGLCATREHIDLYLSKLQPPIEKGKKE